MSKDSNDKKHHASNVQRTTSNVEVTHSVHQQTSSGGVKKNGLGEKVDELTADLQRVHAEFANFRRRSDDERGAFLDLAKQDVLRQLLPVFDNISLAMIHVPKEIEETPWAKGIAQIAKQADTVLKNMGVESFGEVGDPFDPNLHEAIAYELYDSGSKELQQETSEFVSEVLQSGYKLGSKVIRHAMVKVGRK